MSISSIIPGQTTLNPFFHNGPDILAKQTDYLSHRELANLRSVDKFTHSVVQKIKQEFTRALLHVDHLLYYFENKIFKASKAPVKKAIAEFNYRQFIYRNFSQQPEHFNVNKLLNGDPANSAKVKKIYEEKIYHELWEDLTQLLDPKDFSVKLADFIEISPTQYWSFLDLIRKKQGKIVDKLHQFSLDVSNLKIKHYDPLKTKNLHKQLTKIPKFHEIQREIIDFLQDSNNLLVQETQAQTEEIQANQEYTDALKAHLQLRSQKSLSKVKQKASEAIQKEMVLTQKQVEKANFYRSWLNSQPEEFLNSIESITLKKNHLIPTELKHYLQKMKNLKVIDLTEASVASITQMPEWLSKISTIQEIRLKGNNLEETGIPKSVLDMPNVTVIADFSKIPWSYPRHKLASVIDTIKNLACVVILVDSMSKIANDGFIFRVLTGLAILSCVFCPLIPFVNLMAHNHLLKGFVLDLLVVSYFLIGILTGSLTALLARRMEESQPEVEEVSLTLLKIIKLSLFVFGIVGLTYGLTTFLPSILPQLVNLTGYASTNIFNALALTAYTIALIPSYYAIYTTYRDIWNQFTPEE